MEAEMIRLAIDVCRDCARGRGPLPMGGKELCRDPLCFFFEEVRPSSTAMPVRVVPMVTAAEIEQARQLGEDIGPAVLELVRQASRAAGCGCQTCRTCLREALKPWSPPPPRPMDELVERRSTNSTEPLSLPANAGSSPAATTPPASDDHAGGGAPKALYAGTREER